MITLESRDKVAVLRLENGVTNAINPEFVRHITQALAEVRDHYQGLVLAGGAKFFSIGFDLPVPLLADLMLRQLVGDRAATTLLYGGELLTVAAAEEIGLLDKLVPEEELEESCVKMIADLAIFSRPAFAEIKANRVDPLLDRHHKHHQAKNQAFLDCWFSPAVQEWLCDAAKKF